MSVETERGLNWKASLCAAACAALMSTPALAGGAVLSTAAVPDPALPGGSVSVAVSVSDIVDLYAYQFSLLFDPALLQATGVSSGSFLADGGPTFFIPGTIDNGTGRIGFIVDTLQGATPGVSGSGLLASISFDVVAAGTSALNFENVLFLDSMLGDIQMTVQAGSVTAVPEPASMLLMGLGIAALLALRRRQAA
jgi:hypothetical protein